MTSSCLAKPRAKSLNRARSSVTIITFGDGPILQSEDGNENKHPPFQPQRERQAREQRDAANGVRRGKARWP
jgi:hypothetical protein